MVTFDTGDANLRVFAPSIDTGFRVLPAAPAGAQWNTASDGSGAWFSGASSTLGTGITDLHALAPATLEASTDPLDLTATAGEPFIFPVTVPGPDATPLSPQPPVSYTSADCSFDSAGVFAVTAVDIAGNPVDAATAVLSSSVSTDVINAHSVTLPHASTHVIAATLEGATTSVTIEVTPSVVPPAGGSASGPAASAGLTPTGADDGTVALLVARLTRTA